MPRLILALTILLCWSVAQSQEIVLRHALQGRQLEALSTLVARFNGENKGQGVIVLQDAKEIADRRQLPHLAFLDVDDAMMFFDSRPRYRPLAQIMAEAGEKIDAKSLLPQIADAVDDSAGRIQALPLGMALPVLFFNRDAFRKAGLEVDSPPKTWWAVQKAAGALYDVGYRCPLTSSRFNWIHLENLASQHGEPILGSALKGTSSRANLNSMVHVKHVAMLSSWSKSHYFRYFGPDKEADGHFASGECAMLTGESTLYAELLRDPRFDVGVTSLPYYDDVYGATPFSVLPDGAALWALANKSKKEYRVIARFVKFMLRSESQRDWVRSTGFLPMTAEAIDALKAAGIPATLLEAARKRLSAPRLGAARPRVGPWRARLHDSLDEEIRYVWDDTKPAKEALDTAMRHANGEWPAAAGKRDN